MSAAGLAGFLAIAGVAAYIQTLTGFALASQQEPKELYKVGLGSVRFLMAFGDLMIGWRLLPERTSLAGFLGTRREMKYFTEVAIPADSGIVGMNVNEVKMFKREAVRVIDVLRGDASLRAKSASEGAQQISGIISRVQDGFSLVGAEIGSVARAAIGVAALPKGAQVEMDAILVID